MCLVFLSDNVIDTMQTGYIWVTLVRTCAGITKMPQLTIPSLYISEKPMISYFHTYVKVHMLSGPNL